MSEGVKSAGLAYSATCLLSDEFRKIASVLRASASVCFHLANLTASFPSLASGGVPASFLPIASAWPWIPPLPSALAGDAETPLVAVVNFKWDTFPGWRLRPAPVACPETCNLET